MVVNVFYTPDVNLVLDWAESNLAGDADAIAHTNNLLNPEVPVTAATVQQRRDKRVRYARQFEKLCQEHLPAIPQRSKAWFDMQDGMITASDLGQALGQGTFVKGEKGPIQVVMKKSKHEPDRPTGNINPNLEWGQRFEPVVEAMYERITGAATQEFWLIPHPTISYFGASPDGIVKLAGPVDSKPFLPILAGTCPGVMLEYKAPAKKVINGGMYEQYYYQIQGQLYVAGLEECDLLELKFETDPIDKFFWPRFSDPAQLDDPKGIYLVLPDGAPPAYSPVDCDEAGLRAWLAENKAKHPAARPVMWRLTAAHFKRIYLDHDFIEDKVNSLKPLWDEVIKCRQDFQYYSEKYHPAWAVVDLDPNAVAPAGGSNHKQVKLEGFAIMSDDEDGDI
eukprot:jgi/Chrzof1/12584/UNPLg00537.t1